MGNLIESFIENFIKKFGGVALTVLPVPDPADLVVFLKSLARNLVVYSWWLGGTGSKWSACEGERKVLENHVETIVSKNRVCRD